MSIEFTASSLIHFLASFLGLLSVVILWMYANNKFDSYKWLALALIPLSIGLGIGFLAYEGKLFFPTPLWVTIQVVAVLILIASVFVVFKRNRQNETKSREVDHKTDKEHYPQDTPKKDPEISNSAYDLDPEVATEILIELEILMHEDFPYLNHGYALSDLAGDIGYPYYQISTVINQEFGMNFNDYINRYRIEFCKQNMESERWSHLTLEAIAHECGFNNRNSFTNAFKKFSGETPSKYLKSSKTV